MESRTVLRCRASPASRESFPAPPPQRWNRRPFRFSRSSIKPTTATRTFPDRNAGSEVRNIPQDRHRPSASIPPIQIQIQAPKPKRRSLPPLRRRINLESPVLSSAQMHAAEESAFARGVAVETLMDQAGAGVARAVRQFFPKPATCIVFAGKGHNGGDALVAAEQLQRIGWKIDTRLPFGEENCSELTQKKLKALREAKPKAAQTIAHAPQIIILDGLLGTGAKSFLR